MFLSKIECDTISTGLHSVKPYPGTKTHQASFPSNKALPMSVKNPWTIIIPSKMKA